MGSEVGREADQGPAVFDLVTSEAALRHFAGNLSPMAAGLPGRHRCG